MKENRDFGMLENADTRTLELLSEIPVLSKEEKERMLAMSKKKLNSMNTDGTKETNTEEVQVSGVERYSRPRWKIFAPAAACLLLAGGIAGTALTLRNSSKPETDSIAEPTSAAVFTEETTYDMSEIQEEAKQLLNTFNLLNDLSCGAPGRLHTDDNDTRTVEFDNNTYIYKRINKDPDYIDMLKSKLYDTMTGEMFAEFNDLLFTGERPNFMVIDDNYYYYETDNNIHEGKCQCPPNVEFESCEIWNYDGSSFDLFIDWGITGTKTGTVLHTVRDEDKWKFSTCSDYSDDKGSDEFIGEYTKTAGKLLDELQDTALILSGGGVEIGTESKTVSLSNGETVTYHIVTDNDFGNIGDVRKYVKAVVAEPLLSRYFACIYDDNLSEAPMFREIDGKLYFRDSDGTARFSFIGEPVVSNPSPAGFLITAGNRIADGTEQLLFNVSLENDQWKINGFSCLSESVTGNAFNSADGDPESIARESLETLNDLISVYYGKVQTDKNYTTEGRTADTPSQTAVYERVTDPRISSADELISYISERAYGDYRDHCINAATGVQNYTGSPIYIEKDGKLYRRELEDQTLNFTGDPEVVSAAGNAITVRADVSSKEYGRQTYGIYLRFEDGKWKIKAYSIMQ